MSLLAIDDIAEVRLRGAVISIVLTGLVQSHIDISIWLWAGVGPNPKKLYSVVEFHRRDTQK